MFVILLSNLIFVLFNILYIPRYIWEYFKTLKRYGVTFRKNAISVIACSNGWVFSKNSFCNSCVCMVRVHNFIKNHYISKNTIGISLKILEVEHYTESNIFHCQKLIRNYHVTK